MNYNNNQDRIKMYLSKIPGSISGQGGHAQLYNAAVALVQGFSMEPEAAESLLLEEYNPHCTPEWSVNEIRHKVESALKDYNGARRRGWLLEGRNDYPGGNYSNQAKRPYRGVQTPYQWSAKTSNKTASDKPKPEIYFYRQDRNDGYFWRIVKEMIYSGKTYKTEYYWNGFRYENQPDGRVNRSGRVLIEDWIHLYDDGAGLPYHLVNRMKWNDGRKIPALYHWEPARGRYEAGDGGLPKIPYNAIELKEASFVRITEGEKCADCLAAFLASHGLLDVDNAVTCFGGCTSFKPGLSVWFEGKEVLIYADNDEAGRRGAKKIAAALASVAASVRAQYQWPEGFPEHGDIADLIQMVNQGRKAA